MKMKRKMAAALSAVVAISAFSMIPAFAADLMNPPVVEVEQGQLRGVMDGDVYSFLGVPYAYVPERFALPQDPESWEGIRNAQAFGPICPIPDQTSVGDDELVWPHRYWIQNENCQVLNIWSKDINPETKKPVLVYIHGGGYNNGSSIEGVAHDGRNLTEYGDVVTVSINHRLNVLGYLDLSSYGGEFENACNLGDADMVQALKWVYENIDSFGGDPENITIMGQSGGGRKVQSMLHYEENAGIVKQAVVQSSSALSLLDKETASLVAEQTLENLGLDENTISEIKTVDYKDLITAAVEAQNTVGEELGTSVKWQPVENEGVISETYCDWASDVPMIVGSVLTEQTSSFRVGDGRKNEWTEEEVLANLTEKYGDKAQDIADAFAEAYPDKKVADAFFYGASHRENVKKVALEKTESGTAPVYTFMFTYETPVNGGVTAFHCNDIIYFLHNVEIPIITKATGGEGNLDALALQDTMANALLNFMKTGNPSTEELPWEAFTAETPNSMRFDIESKCGIIADEKLNELCLSQN